MKGADGREKDGKKGKHEQGREGMVKGRPVGKRKG